jgi:hypothetical protein
MAAIILSDEQVVELVKQLPVERQTEVFRFLLLQQWGAWGALSRYGIDQARWVAQERGLDWDEMTEEVREAFVDCVVNEA